MEDPQPPEELARIHEQLWQTVLQFGNFSASQERNRIARDLHDSLGQALTALNIQLQTAVKLWQLDPQQAEQFLAEAQRLGSTAVQEVRQTVRTLRTDCPDDQSLDTLLASLVDSFHRSTGVLPIVQLQLAAPLPPEVVTPVYRIVQEALNNICKYAQATAVTVQLSTTPTSLGLIIEDNGRGFDLQQTVTGFGLRGMQERVSLLRGRFQVETQPGAGCRIRVVMPLRVLSLQESPDLIPPPLTSTQGDTGHPSHNLAEMPPAVPPSEAPALTSTADADPHPTADPPLADELAFSDKESIVPAAPMLPTLPKAALSPTQHEHLTQLLLQWVGPIAPLLVQQALAQAEQATDLLQSLVAYVPAHYQAQFQHHLQALVQTELPLEPAVPPLPTQLTPPGSVPPPAAHLPLALNPDLAHRCEQELTAVIGPIAPLLVQEAIASATSLEQFVDCLAAHIPQPQVAARFKAHLLNLQS